MPKRKMTWRFMLISREIALSVVNKDIKGQVVRTTVLSAGIVAKEVI